MADYKSIIENYVDRYCDEDQSQLSKACLKYVERGYDQSKFADKLTTFGLSTSRASKLSSKILNAVEEKSSRKRKYEDDETSKKPRKLKKFTEDPNDEYQSDSQNDQDTKTDDKSTSSVSASSIRAMIANAKKQIKQFKADVDTKKTENGHVDQSAHIDLKKQYEATERAKKAAELTASIQSRLKSLKGTVPSIPVGTPTTVEQKTSGVNPSGPVILDLEGQVVDARTGLALQLNYFTPTLKANIHAKKREQFKQQLTERPVEDIGESSFFDPRVVAKQANIRTSRKQFSFIEKGKYEKLAATMRVQAQLDKLQSEISQIAKKTGIAQAARLASLPSRRTVLEVEIPVLEWWDAVIMSLDDYTDLGDKVTDINNYLGITRLVEHPIQMKIQSHSKPVSIPVYLTKKEKKKMRRQNRLEVQKEEQEKIRLGLLPPPEPKVKLANMMRVLAQEAVADPTQVEARVRAQMAKRQKAHETANKQRKLTKPQKREKNIKKMQEDTSYGVRVSIYRVHDFGNPAHKFKVETNAKQLQMTGFVVLFKDCNVVVVEGGPKQQKKFKRLMLIRVKWGESGKGVKAIIDEDEREDHDFETQNQASMFSEEEEKKVANAHDCALIWEGLVKQRAFGEIIFKACPTEPFAREQFRRHGVEHYWDLAYNAVIAPPQTT